jgi:HAD superfamily hydrolase (TIGR01509 family)
MKDSAAPTRKGCKSGPSAPKLIIFDCDGVLVDSEPISIGVLLDVLAREGRIIDEASAYRQFLGRSMATIGKQLETDFDFVITEEHLEDIRHELYARFHKELQPIRNIRAALEQLAVPFCVASSSQPERIRLSLDVTGLLDLFEPHIYSAVMVKHGKPAPDLFLHAARAMGVRAGDCIVVEDSPAGIEAAKRAGMPVFAFHGGSHDRGGMLAADLATLHPDRLFDDMLSLPRLVTDWPGQEARR